MFLKGEKFSHEVDTASTQSHVLAVDQNLKGKKESYRISRSQFLTSCSKDFDGSCSNMVRQVRRARTTFCG
jgi:hypothetical protein